MCGRTLCTQLVAAALGCVLGCGDEPSTVPTFDNDAGLVTAPDAGSQAPPRRDASTPAPIGGEECFQPASEFPIICAEGSFCHDSECLAAEPCQAVVCSAGVCRGTSCEAVEPNHEECNCDAVFFSDRGCPDLEWANRCLDNEDPEDPGDDHVAEPLRAQCPSSTDIQLGDVLRLMPTVSGGAGGNQYNWQSSGPSTRDPIVDEGMRPRFIPQQPGAHTVTLTVTDSAGQTATCQTVINVGQPGIFVELTWNDPGDMDLHMLSPDANRWFNRQDCHYANCTNGINWGQSDDTRDNPSLSVDNTHAYGPEQIRIERPRRGVYRVGIHAYSGTSRSTVLVTCQRGSTTRSRTFGPRRTGNDGHRFWRVADIEIGDGTCRIREVNTFSGVGDAESQR